MYTVLSARSWAGRRTILEAKLDITDLSLALSSAKVGVWKWLLHDDAVIWSPEVFEIFRVDPEMFEGRLTFEQYQDRIHEDDRELVNTTIEGALQTRDDYRIEHRLRFEDEIRWVRGQGRALLDDAGNVVGLTGAVMDITRERRDLDELAMASERFRLYSELASDYIYSADLTTPIITPSIVGGSFERTTGYTPQEVADLGGWIGLMHPDDQGATEALMEELAKGRPVVNEYRLRTKDGQYRWLRDRILPVLSESGELIGINGGVQDITERRSLLDQLSHAQKMEALALLAGNVAHDFNNLLTAMFAAADLIRIEAKTELTLGALDTLAAASTRAADLTSSLLTFSRRQVAIRHSKQLSEVLTGAMPILRRAIGEKVSITLDQDTNGVIVAVDSSQIELALLNLVVNARDAMPKGGVIAIRTTEVTWDEQDSKRPPDLAPGTYGSVAVSDTGSGIDNATMPRLFEPFFTTKDVGSGTGLGLAAVHGVVRLHEGAIHVDSEPGKGSTFTIFIPTSDGVPTSLGRGPSNRSAIGGTERILLVEDDSLVRSVTMRSLMELGYQVESAETAEDAMALVEGADLVLTDVRLPGMPGTELALQIAERWPDKPIVLMSGLVEDDAQKAVIESEKFLFMHKPFTQEGLARRLRQALGDE